MGRIVILEGPDGSGKTRLAARLMLRGFEYRHEGPSPEGEPAAAYYKRRIVKLLADGRDFVLDRFHLGAAVYGPIARGRTEITVRELKKLDMFLSAVGVRTVICLPPYSECFSAWARRAGTEYLQSAGQLRRVWLAFRRLARGRETHDWTSGRPFRLGRGQG